MSSPGTRAPRPHDLLSAYRAELDRQPSRDEIAPDDGEWLTIGTLFERAPGLPPTRAKAVRRLAGNQLRTLLGEPRWKAGSPIDPAPPRSAVELAPRVRILCEDIEDADAVGFADVFALTYLASGDTVSQLEQGRFDALRARFAWTRGDHDKADELYQRVVARGKRIKAPELAARAEIGNAILARLRGNWPATRAASERAMTIAESHGFVRLAGMAHHSLMVVAATMKDHNAALHHAWQAYEAVRGDPVAEGAQLTDLGRLFYEDGYPELAEAAFSAALQRPLPTRILLPALGIAALAAARRGERSRVVTLADQVRHEGDRNPVPYAMAASLLDVAESLAIVGDANAGDTARRMALDVARANGYHKLEYRAEHLNLVSRLAAATPLDLSHESAEIGSAIRGLADSAA